MVWSRHITGPTGAGRPRTQPVQSSYRHVGKGRPAALLEREGNASHRREEGQIMITVVKSYRVDTIDCYKNNNNSNSQKMSSKTVEGHSEEHQAQMLHLSSLDLDFRFDLHQIAI